MIIECKNCNKKFNVSDNLIPVNGRHIQCGSCDYKWFYKIDKSAQETLILDSIEDKIETDADKEDGRNLENKSDHKSKNTKNKHFKITSFDSNIKIKSQNNFETSNITNFFSYLLVFIISFIALIILADTFKAPLIIAFPGLEFILLNLFETLKDIKLFIIDLT